MEELLSIKLRPKSLKDIIGQEHLVGENKVIYNLVKNKKLFSMILYGHPGIGKTSIATAIAEELGMRYRNLNAVVNNKKDFDTVIEEAKLYDGLIKFKNKVDNIGDSIKYESKYAILYFEVKNKVSEEDIQKEIDELEKSINKRKNLLSNENFVKRAPENIVANEKQKLAEEEEKLSKLKN